MKITKKAVESIAAQDKTKLYPDDYLKGFYLKVTPAGSKSYVVQYRTDGRRSPTKRYTIGKHGPITAEQARREAIRILGMVAQGEDPQGAKQAGKQAITLAEFCDLYLRDGCAAKKPSTIATDRGRIERHIKPLLGKRKVAAINKADVKRFLRDVAEGRTAANYKTGKFGLARVTGGKGTATRTVGLLGGILSFAVDEGLRTDNPVKGIKRFDDRKMDRYLSLEEISRLGEVLNAAEKDESEYIFAIAAVRLLILSACRKTEILSLTWDEVDFQAGALRLKDSKTGQKIVPLGAPALTLLSELPRISNSKWVFPAQRGDGHYVGLPKVWLRLRKKADLEDVRLHDLRHTFASVGAAQGISLGMVGALLGHKDPNTTARYSHIPHSPARAAADKISNQISEAMKIIHK